PIEGVFPKQLYDSLFGRPVAKVDTSKADSLAAAKARADSIAKVRADSAARADSIRRAAAIEPGLRRRRPERTADTAGRGPLTTRPELYDRLVVRTKAALEPNGRYVVEVSGVRSVSRIPGRASQGFRMPEEKKPPPV